MKILLIILVFIQSAFALDFDHYYSVDEINAYMLEQSKKFPALARYKSLGLSAQSREISLIILSIGSADTKEAIYFNGTHHGNEKSSTEAVLGLIDYFIKNANRPEVAAYLEKYALYFQPLVNPDGHAQNTRTLSNGIDPNRDYSFPGKQDQDAFKQIEIQLVKELADKIKFKGALAYHSGIVEILWPWCHTSDQSRDHSLMAAITKEMALATNVKRFMPSYYDYPTDGEFIDYVHWKHGTVALTVEVSAVKTPPIKDIPDIVVTSIKGALSFLNSLSKADAGTMSVSKSFNLLDGMTGRGRSASELE